QDNSQQIRLADDLKAIVSNRQVVLRLQPQGDRDGQTCGAEALLRWTPEKALATVTGYLAVFCTASLAVRLLAVLAGQALKRWKLEKIDRAAGAALGAAKGLAVAAIVVVILGRFGTPRLRNAVRESFLASKVVWLADLALGKSQEIGFEEKARDAGASLKAAAEKLRARSGLSPLPEQRNSQEKNAEDQR
ncbi:MAG: CvpA family protein, partial [Planctomycetota bacterium]|nr:CvpA family protein [Planctomycetota bacterium]